MVYIYTEDSTSGFDFIRTIIWRVIKPKKQYTIKPLNGAQNCIVFLRNIDCNQYSQGDILILYFDPSTIDYPSLDIALLKLKSVGVNVYIQGYYCFESAFYSYKPFFDGTFSFGRYQMMLNDFKACMDGTASLRNFQQKYAQVLHTTATLETTANIVYSVCTYATKCVWVSKQKYQNTLDNCLKKQLEEKAYFNNMCNRYSANDVLLHKYNKCTSCKVKHIQGFCKVKKVHRGTSANLRNFYNNTVLSAPFIMRKDGKEFVTDKTLSDLLN